MFVSKYSSARKILIIICYITLLKNKTGISSSMNPNLQPSTDQLLCPGDNITYTCQANDTHLMLWSAEPHFSISSTEFRYTLAAYYYNESMEKSYKNMFFGNLTGYVGNVNNSQIADTITTTMTVITSGLKNVTNITCLIFIQQNMFSSSSLLYIIEKPNYVGKEIETSTSYLPVVLELGELFDGRGVPIDHYIIQLDNGTQLKTANSTYSFDIMYNTTLSVNISAHNCAGYSPFFPLVIQYVQDRYVTIEEGNATLTSPYGIVLSDPTMPYNETEGTPKFQDIYLLLITGGLLFITILISVGVALPLLFFIYQKWHRHKIHNQEEKCRMEENTAYGVTVSGPDYNMENNPLYEMRSNQQGSETLTTTHVYECVKSFK